MNLDTHIDRLRDQLTAAAEMGGSESRAVVERLSASLEAATRLVLLEVLSAAADAITVELVPGAVEVRLRGGDPEFVVTLPSDTTDDVADQTSAAAPLVIPDGDEYRGTSRLNLRLPASLKTRVDEAARREGLSLNTWLVRATATAVENPRRQVVPHSRQGSQRYTGWVR